MFKIDKIVSGGLYCQSDNKQVFPLNGLTNISIGEPCDIDKNVDSMTDNRDGTISFEIGKFVRKEAEG